MRIVPVPDELTAPYWAAAGEHRLAVQRCEGCGRLTHPPVARCPACHGDAFTWPTLSGRGRVHTYSVAMHSVHPVSEGHTPYVIALVELEEGPRILTNLRGVEPEAVRVGMAVEAVFEDVDDGLALPQFAPARDNEETRA